MASVAVRGDTGALTNLESILKSRDITLPAKVCIIKAVVFPVVMFGCELDHKEGWVLKNWCFWTVVLKKILESPLDSKESKPVSSRGNQPWIFIERTIAETEAPILWPPDAKSQLTRKKPWCWGKTEGKRRRGWQRMRWLDSITDLMDKSSSKLQEIKTGKPAVLQSMGWM